MEKGTFSNLSILFIVVISLTLPHVTLGNPRTETVNITCQTQLQHNSVVYIGNFATAMENIRPQMQTKGYAADITGKGNDTIYTLVQCYGDLPLTDCALCFSMINNLSPGCYPFNGGTFFLDGCFMRTEMFSFFEDYTGPNDKVICGNRTTKSLPFQETARRAVLQAASYAPNNNGYARAEMRVSEAGEESAYVLANCWETLNASSCRACLENASSSMLECLPWSEGRALYAGCFMRYSDIIFLNPIPSNSSSSGIPTVVIAVVASSTIVVVGAIIVAVYMWMQRRRKNDKRQGSYYAKKFARALIDSSLNFKFSTLEKATNGFDEANKLGQGGNGIVYKGILQDGREIAVKRLFSNNAHRAEEFYNEVNIISGTEHKNLVRLLGCSLSGPDSLLVYEYLPNKSLDHFIFDPDRGKELNWEKRFGIIIGTAEGLVYLHENTNICLIHRDIKASNILLDARFHAKIADFGLVRAFEEDKSHVSTRVVGTLGYMAPEYIVHGQLTEKADVYSFGVLLLEIVTGKQGNMSRALEYSNSLTSIAWDHFQHGISEELIDPNLMLHDLPDIKDEVLRVIHVGILCTQELPALRPSMSKALQMLVKGEDLPTPSNPPFYGFERSILSDFSIDSTEQPFQFDSSTRE